MKRRIETSIILLFGVVLSLAIGYASLWALGGAGHGWCSSMWSVLIIFFLPMVGVGFLPHRRRALLHIAWYVTVGFVAVDVLLIGSTSSEGWSAVRRTAEAVPGMLAGWITIWMILHLCVAFLWWRISRISEQKCEVGSAPG